LRKLRFLAAVSFLMVAHAGFRTEARAAGNQKTLLSGVSLSWAPEDPAQGDVLRFRVELPEEMQIIRGTLAGGALLFSPRRGLPGSWEALGGIDADKEPGRYEVALWISPRQGGRERAVRDQIRLRPRAFGKEEFKLPDSMVHLGKEAGKRVEREKKITDALWPRTTPERMWEGPFLVPVQGTPGSPFGLRRWINGEPRSFHTGEDIQAPEGAPVLASNRGRVCLVGDFFFGGKSVFVDHGQGLYTMYFHLSEILVQSGGEVRKGQILGRVGATGRATGPHLHWGVRLGGARVDPEALRRATEQPEASEDPHEG
jgi:murein DD-endopeptidase MepM/ murein hydrolase activator NlpD